MPCSIYAGLPGERSRVLKRKYPVGESSPMHYYSGILSGCRQHHRRRRGGAEPRMLEVFPPPWQKTPIRVLPSHLVFQPFFIRRRHFRGPARYGMKAARSMYNARNMMKLIAPRAWRVCCHGHRPDGRPSRDVLPLEKSLFEEQMVRKTTCLRSHY